MSDVIGLSNRFIVCTHIHNALHSIENTYTKTQNEFSLLAIDSANSTLHSVCVRDFWCHIQKSLALRTIFDMTFFSVAWHENSCTSWDVWRLYISLKIFRYLYIGNGFTFRIRRTNMNSASFRFHVIFTIYLSITQNDRKVLKIAKEIASMKD